MKKTFILGLVIPLAALAFANGPAAFACGSGGCGGGFWFGNQGSNTTILDTNTSNTTVNNSNNATVTNNVSVSADTGGNTATGGAATANGSFLDGSESAAQGGTVVTGDAVAVSNIANFVNSNETNLAIPVNNDDDGALLTGLNFTNLNDNDPFDRNNTSITDLDSVNTSVNNSNNANIDNEGNVGAFTGNNTATGGAATAGSNTTWNWNLWNNPCFTIWFHNNNCETNSFFGNNNMPSTANAGGGEVFTGNSLATSSVVNYLNWNASWLQ